MRRGAAHSDRPAPTRTAAPLRLQAGRPSSAPITDERRGTAVSEMRRRRAGGGKVAGGRHARPILGKRRGCGPERPPTTGRRGSRGSGARGRSEAELAVRAEAHEIEMFGVGLAVDQNQVGADVTVPVVFPLPARCVVAMAGRERPVLRQFGHDLREPGIDGPGEAALLLAPVIPLEGRGPSNRPHGGRPSGRRHRRP